MKISWWSRILDFISPRLCVVCGERLAVTERTLCACCTLHLPYTAYQFTPTDNPMCQLLWKLSRVERAAALLHYEPRSELAAVVYQLKYGDRPDIGEDMGALMGRELQRAHFLDGIDVLVPVPLTWWREQQRGYNQSERLAVGISDVTGLPIARKALRRKRFLQTQTHLNRQERQENVSDMFELRDGRQVEGRHVLLVDDICTTGATLTACANALSAVPGVRVSVCTLGLTKS
ncbi:MAG: ComF family protein [Prevotella sp.]|nr:ComF family protein [Prevotella sp.]